MFGEHYFIEAAPPTQSAMEATPIHSSEPHPNLHTFTRAVPKPSGQQCSTKSSVTRELGRRSSERGSLLKRRRRKRLAVSLEHFIEVAVVTEPDMLKDRSLEDLEAYIFSLMNIVSCNESIA